MSNLPAPDAVVPTTITPRAISLNAHFSLDPHHLIQPGDHPMVKEGEPPFVATAVLFSIGINREGRLTVDATLHSEYGRDSRGCLQYDQPRFPNWLPVPPEGWESFAADMWAYLTGTEVQA